MKNKHKNKFYFDITLMEIAYWYMLRKRIDLTTGNLFTVMENILQRIDLINKNNREKIIKFDRGICEFKDL